MPKKEDLLFPEPHEARYGQHRRRRKLILPGLLNSESLSQNVCGKKYRQAHELLIKSANFCAENCSWDRKTALEEWIANRVLKLICNRNNMIPLPEAAGSTPPVHKWKSAERANIQVRLDVDYFHLYGLAEDNVQYIPAPSPESPKNPEPNSVPPACSLVFLDTIHDRAKELH